MIRKDPYITILITSFYVVRSRATLYMTGDFRCSYRYRNKCTPISYRFLVSIDLIRMWSTSVSIVSDCRLDDQGSIAGRGKGFFLKPLCPDLLWGPPAFYPGGTGSQFPGVNRGRGVTLTAI